MKKTKIKYHWGSILGEKYLKSYHHIYPAQVRLINSKFAFGMELTNCVFDDRYGRNHIFWGDQYIGRDYVEFLNFQKNFKIDILTYTTDGWKNIGQRKTIKFSKETISADLEEEFFKKIEKNIQKTSLKFLNIEKGHIKLLKHNNKIYLYIKIFIKKKEKMNMYQSHCRIFIFELDEFLKNGSIVERDLDDDCLRIRSQISHLSLDRHDSIAF